MTDSGIDAHTLKVCTHKKEGLTLAFHAENDNTEGSHFYLCADCGDAIFTLWGGGHVAAYSLDYTNMSNIMLEMARRRKVEVMA